MTSPLHRVGIGSRTGDWIQLRTVEPTGGLVARREGRPSPRASWDDLVLPDDTLRMLRAIAHRHEDHVRVYDDWGFAERMDRGPGITALFVGRPGTGKSLAARVLASTLNLELCRIDLSRVVSKYIGETEKNLRRIFDAAEDGGALLFLDEADALFGKRSDVRDSHDRYANLELQVLLAEMEAYAGIAIIAMQASEELEPAFLRRLRFIVNFPFPSVAERQRIWEKVFPSSAPLGPLDFASLAEIELTGGMIREVALNAAFRAAHEQTSITMDLIGNAACTELRKWDRPVPEACAE